MEELISKVKTTGHIKMTVIRENGKKEVVYDKHNTIQDAYLIWLNDKIRANSAGDKSLNDLFTAVATPPTSGKDGIVIINGSTHYCCDCAGTYLSYTLGWSGSGAARKLTASFTGYAVTLDSVDDFIMGFNHNGSTAFATNFAKPDSLSATITLGATDSLIIEWTITFADA